MKKFLLPIISILLIFTSCSYTFYGGVTGSVADAETGNPIDDVLVALYTDETARDEDFNDYDEENHNFTPSRQIAVAKTTNGQYSFSKFYWNTNDSDFGKDADVTNVYLNFYHKDYGIVKSDKIFTISSESTSQLGTTEMKSIIDTYTYNVNFLEVTGSESSLDTARLDSSIQFRYSYKDYRGVNQVQDAVATGTFPITVTYYNDGKTTEIPSVTLSSIESTNKEVKGTETIDQFTRVSIEEGSLTDATKDVVLNASGVLSQSDNIYFKKNYFTISISGQVIESSDSVNGINNVAVSLSESDDKISFSSTPQAVYTHSESGVGENRLSGIFSGLGSDIVIFIDDSTSYPVKAKVNVSAGIEEATPVGLDINSNQSDYSITLDVTTT